MPRYIQIILRYRSGSKLYLPNIKLELTFCFLYFQTANNQNVITTPPRTSKANHVATPNKANNQLTVNTHKAANQSMTFPRPSSNKPPPSPTRDSRISFVTDQPKHEDFTWSAFTPISQEVFENAYTRHKYFYKFSDKVLKQGTKMKSSVWDVAGKPGEAITYEQLLQGKEAAKRDCSA